MSVFVCTATDLDFSPLSALPVIKPIRFFSLRSFFSKTPTSFPSLITVALSLILTNSAILCVTIKTATPFSFNSRIFLNSLSVESKSKAAEDSSKINNFVFSLRKALAIVIHAFIGKERLKACVYGSTYSPTRSSIISWALITFSLCVKFLYQKSSEPTNRLSTTDASSAIITS